MQKIWRHNFMGTEVEDLLEASIAGDHARVGRAMQSDTIKKLQLDQSECWFIGTALSNAIKNNYCM